MIYVASSWRNPRYEGILDCLEQWALPYYNWRDEEGFHWSDVFNTMTFFINGEEKSVADLKVSHWTDPIPGWVFANALRHKRAQAGFLRDMSHLEAADAVVLLLPCGKNAHLEAGWAVGHGKPVALYVTEPLQPELMYGMFDLITEDINDLMHFCHNAHLNAEVKRRAEQYHD